MRLDIKILTGTQDGEVWLWFRIVSKLNRALDAENGTVGDLTTHERIQPFDNRSMAWPNWTHGAYLTVYQLNTVIFSEDTRLYHPCEVGNRKLPAENLDRHKSSFVSNTA